MTIKLDELLTTCGCESIEARREIAQHSISEVLTTIFEEIPELNLIVTLGYTPGFCDGDPCYRNFQVAVDAYDPDEAMISFWDDLYEVDTSINENLDEEQLRLFGLMTQRKQIEPSTWDYKTRCSVSNDLTDLQLNITKAQKIISSLDDDFELAYGDNMTVEIIRTDNGFDISAEDYDCGH